MQSIYAYFYSVERDCRVIPSIHCFILKHLLSSSLQIVLLIAFMCITLLVASLVCLTLPGEMCFYSEDQHPSRNCRVYTCVLMSLLFKKVKYLEYLH